MDKTRPGGGFGRVSGIALVSPLAYCERILFWTPHGLLQMAVTHKEEDVVTLSDLNTSGVLFLW